MEIIEKEKLDIYYNLLKTLCKMKQAFESLNPKQIVTFEEVRIY